MNQDRVVEHQPADSYELASDQPKAMDSPDLCVHSGDNANIVEILHNYISAMLYALRLPKIMSHQLIFMPFAPCDSVADTLAQTSTRFNTFLFVLSSIVRQ